MYRRYYLGVCGTALLAGCGSSDDSGGGNDGGGATTPAQDSRTATTEPEGEDEDTISDPEPAEFELVGMDFPTEVALEEEYTPEITVRNVGGQPGDFEAPIYTRVADSDWQKGGTWSWSDVPPGTTETAQGADGWHHNYLYEYEYSIGDFDTTVSVETTPFRAAIGDTYPAPDGIEVTVTELRLTARYEYENYDGETVAEEAPDGSQWALVTMRSENTGDSEARLPSAYSTDLVAGNSQYETTTISKDKNQYDGGEVQPGVVREGWIAYELPESVVQDDVEVVWSGVVGGGNVTAIWTPA